MIELNIVELEEINGGFKQEAYDAGYEAGAIVRKAFGFFGLFARFL
ncbi:hypothetical protein [Ancylomarina longa]|nr:hypothetical protein [Ancylomarina longa]